MKKIVVVVAVLVLALVVAPWGVGKVAEKRLNAGLDKLVEQAPYLKVVDRKWTGGWFKSEQVVTFEAFSSWINAMNPKAIEEAMNMFKLDNGFYPSTAEGIAALVQAPPRARRFNPDGYLSKIPEDPWGNPYLYSTDGRDAVVVSLGADGVEGGEGYNADIDSRSLN